MIVPIHKPRDQLRAAEVHVLSDPITAGWSRAVRPHPQDLSASDHEGLEPKGLGREYIGVA
jgi:hypothetical protein